LLSIKSGLHGTECMDVLSYATTHLAFPHESTANQFFSESQLESYRALGYEIAYKMPCYGERGRQYEAADDAAREHLLALPTNDFETVTSTQRFDQIVEQLRKNLISGP
jgi:hypothetical protein